MTWLATGQVSHEIRYGITSLTAQPAHVRTLAGLWRNHSTIENGLQRTRDVQFGEDASHVRTGKAPHVLAICRNVLSGLLGILGYTSVTRTRDHFAARPFQALGSLQMPVSFPLE